MKQKSQHQKIIEMCKDGLWHCQNDFRALFIFSPHKRRCEIEGRKNRDELPTGMYIFDERPCEHDIKGQKDYRMFVNGRLYKEMNYYVPDLGKNVGKLEKINA